MVVAVRNLDLVEEVAAVGGLERFNVHHVDDVFIARVGDDVHVIPRPLPQAVAGVDELPGLTAVVGAIEAAVGIARLDQGVDAIGIRSDGDADASVWPLRQTMFL